MADDEAQQDKEKQPRIRETSYDDLLSQRHADVMGELSFTFLRKKELEKEISDGILTPEEAQKDQASLEKHLQDTNQTKDELLRKAVHIEGSNILKLCEEASQIEDEAKLQQKIKEIEEACNAVDFAEGEGPLDALQRLARVKVYELKKQGLAPQSDQAQQLDEQINQEVEGWFEYVKGHPPEGRVPGVSPEAVSEKDKIPPVFSVGERARRAEEQEEKRQIKARLDAIQELKEKRVKPGSPEEAAALAQHPNLSEKISSEAPSQKELRELAGDQVESPPDLDQLEGSQGDPEAEAKPERTTPYRNPETRTQECLARIQEKTDRLDVLKDEISTDIENFRTQVTQDLAKLPEDKELTTQSQDILKQLTDVQANLDKQTTDFEQFVKQLDLEAIPEQINQLLENFDQLAESLPEEPESLAEVEGTLEQMTDIWLQIGQLEEQLRDYENQINDNFSQRQADCFSSKKQQQELAQQWSEQKNQATERIGDELAIKLNNLGDQEKLIDQGLAEAASQAGEISQQHHQSLAEITAVQKDSQNLQTLAQEAQQQFIDQDAKDLAQESFALTGEAINLATEAQNLAPQTELQAYLQELTALQRLGNNLQQTLRERQIQVQRLLTRGGEDNIIEVNKLLTLFEADELPKLQEQQQKVQEKLDALAQKTQEFNQKKAEAQQKYDQAKSKYEAGKNKNVSAIEEKLEEYLLKLGEKDKTEKETLENIGKSLQSIENTNQKTETLSQETTQLATTASEQHSQAQALLAQFQGRPQRIQDAIANQMNDLGRAGAEAQSSINLFGEASTKLTDARNNNLQGLNGNLDQAQISYQEKVLRANILVANELRKPQPNTAEIDKLFGEVETEKNNIDQILQQITTEVNRIGQLHQEAEQRIEQANQHLENSQTTYETANQQIEAILGEYGLQAEQEQRENARNYLNIIEQSQQSTIEAYDVSIQAARRYLVAMENDAWVEPSVKREITARLNLYETNRMVARIAGKPEAIVQYFETRIAELTASKRLLTGENLAVLFKENLPGLAINDAFMLWQEANRWEGIGIRNNGQIRFNRENITDEDQERVETEIIDRLEQGWNGRLPMDRQNAEKSLQLARSLASATFEDAIWDQDLATGNPLSQLIYFRYSREKGMPPGLVTGPDLTFRAIEGFGTSLLRSSKLVLKEEDGYTQNQLEAYAQTVNAETEVVRENPSDPTSRIVRVKIKMFRKANIDHDANHLDQATYTHNENGELIVKMLNAAGNEVDVTLDATGQPNQLVQIDQQGTIHYVAIAAADRANYQHVNRTEYYYNTLAENRRGYIYADQMDLENLSADVWKEYAKYLRRNFLLGERLKQTDWMPEDVNETLLENIGEYAYAADVDDDLGIKYWLTAGIIDSIAENAQTKRGVSSWSLSYIKRLFTKDVFRIVDDRQIKGIFKVTKAYGRVRWAVIRRAMFGEELQVV